MPSDKAYAVENRVNQLVSGALDTWTDVTQFANGWSLGASGYFRYRVLLHPHLMIAIRNLKPGSQVSDGTIIVPPGNMDADHLPADYQRFPVCCDALRVPPGASPESPCLEMGNAGAFYCYGIAISATRVDARATIHLDL